jgi:hypothetical protein
VETPITVHGHPPDRNTALRRELALRGLRNTLWCALLFAQQLPLERLAERLLLDIIDIDAQLAEGDEAA